MNIPRFNSLEEYQAWKKARLELFAHQGYRLAKLTKKGQLDGTLKPGGMLRISLIMYRLCLDIHILSSEPYPRFPAETYQSGVALIPTDAQAPGPIIRKHAGIEAPPLKKRTPR